MSKDSIIAVKEDLERITLEEKEGVDTYVEEVRCCMRNMKHGVDAMIAHGDTMNDIRVVLDEDFANLNRNLDRLTSLSAQLSEKADGYRRYLNILKGSKQY